ncbi:LPS assembly lipoprotein LptE [Roseomonas sp. OT10]|uniref:LPS assembly lipoprotein LptE n=1 Tax=Roseomonas cutis TaxID=2897332 RepID=UPI001E504E82|nr:LPS assembly lipoprotein LptE [Roseomonas sp. OT10]UFN48587.1 LPS assembly lipoprotein LptE [Roseomonas sp. OT10]
MSSTSSSEARPGGPSRRGVLRGGLLGGVAAALGGCGFQPLYAPGGPARPAVGTATAEELAAVRVGVIPDRIGQLLRRSLQQQLEKTGGAGVPARYDLRVSVQLGVEQEGFRRDGTPTRSRASATAPWSLYTTATPPVQVASGTERSFDAWNLPDNQFFAADMSFNAAQRRLVDEVASGIVEKVAIALANRTAA